jgi:hypothetical protein
MVLADEFEICLCLPSVADNDVDNDGRVTKALKGLSCLGEASGPLETVDTPLSISLV